MSGIRKIAVRCLIGASVLAIAATTSPTARAADAPFDSIAAELINGINGAEFNQITAVSGYGAPRIAVQSLTVERGALDTGVAAEFNHRLLRELQRQGGSRFRYAAMNSLKPLIQEIQDSGASDAEMERRIADLKQNVRSDILIAGWVRVENDRAIVRYQAVGAETGASLANTKPRIIHTGTATGVAASNIVSKGTRPASRQYTGQVRRTVAEAEWMLTERGYHSGPVDGILTEETRQALSAYQADSALPVNGRLTRNTVDNLRRDNR